MHELWQNILPTKGGTAMIDANFCIGFLGTVAFYFAYLFTREKDLWNYIADGDKLRATAQTDRYIYEHGYNDVLKINSIRLLINPKEEQQ